MDIVLPKRDYFSGRESDQRIQNFIVFLVCCLMGQTPVVSREKEFFLLSVKFAEKTNDQLSMNQNFSVSLKRLNI
jgi:hypothetical protein